MAQYLILVYESEASYASLSPEELQQVSDAHTAFWQKHGSKIVAGNALTPTTTATSVRSDGAGGFTVTDGPFAETKEALGGYYLVEAADLDEAIAIGKTCPAPYGGVEVRPIMVFEG